MKRGFAGGPMDHVAAYERHLANGIAVAPDGRTALITQREHLALDLMQLTNVDIAGYVR